MFPILPDRACLPSRAMPPPVSGTVGEVHRIGIMLCVALPLAALDLAVKASEPTEPWAYHRRSPGWLALSVGLLVAMVLVAQIPSRVVAPAAGVLAAGVLGNSLSAAWNGMEVPNPLVLEFERALIAFNLADVWALAGIFLLMLSLGTWLVGNRERLPSARQVLPWTENRHDRLDG